MVRSLCLGARRAPKRVIPPGGGDIGALAAIAATKLLTPESKRTRWFDREPLPLVRLPRRVTAGLRPVCGVLSLAVFN
jgi:hypothetical protein